MAPRILGQNAEYALGRSDYRATWEAMKSYTDERDSPRRKPTSCG